MLNLNERIVRTKEKERQLIAKKLVEAKRKQDEEHKMGTRRNILIGEYISGYFPEVLNIQPKRTKAENDVEFALFTTVLSLLAEDTEYVSKVVTTAKKLLESH